MLFLWLPALLDQWMDLHVPEYATSFHSHASRMQHQRHLFTCVSLIGSMHRWTHYALTSALLGLLYGALFSVSHVNELVAFDVVYGERHNCAQHPIPRLQMDMWVSIIKYLIFKVSHVSEASRECRYAL